MNVVSFYRFTEVDDPAAVRGSLQALCKRHGLLGTILVAEEGVNGTLAGEGDVIRAVLHRIEKRLSLDTSKNVIVHFFVERALVALAVLALPEPSVDLVRERVQALSRLFKHEFRFRADQPFDAIFGSTVSSMVADEELGEEHGQLLPGRGREGLQGHEWLESYANLLLSFLEGYRVAARALEHLSKGKLAEKELVKKALVLGREMFAAGVIERPEAVSKPVMQNAFLAFVDHGFVASRQGYELVPGATAESVTLIEATIASYLPRGTT